MGRQAGKRTAPEPERWLEPGVTAVAYAGAGHRIRVAFADGLEAEVDLAPLLERFPDSPVFAPLRADAGLFAAVRLEGGTASWPNGADVAPETLYHLATEAAAQPRAAPAPFCAEERALLDRLQRAARAAGTLRVAATDGQAAQEIYRALRELAALGGGAV